MPPNILSIFTVLRGLRPTKFGQFFSLSEVLWSHLTFFHNSGTMNFLSTWPIHLISLPLFYAMPYVVHLHRMWLLVKYTGDFDNLLPRCNNERAERLIANNPKKTTKFFMTAQNCFFNFMLGSRRQILADRNSSSIDRQSNSSTR
jgi:hypothetical protein